MSDGVLVVGAGSLGSVYGARLARGGSRVQLLAREAHARAIEDAGGVVVVRGDEDAVAANRRRGRCCRSAARARQRGNRHDAEVYEVNFDYGCFDAHNLQFELPTYYDKSGNPCLTARQAGRYKPHDSIYFDTGEDLSTLLAIESDQVSALYARYLEEAGSIAGLTYVQWLEAKVLGFPVSA